MNWNLKSAVSALCWMVCGDLASAQAPWVEVRGFGTLTAVRTDDASASYRGYPQPLSLATSTDWSFKPDSLIGVQLDLGSGSPLSGTLQAISRYRETGAFDTEVEWAFLKYQFDDRWRVRLGRLVTPVFMDSEYRFTRFALTTVRADLTMHSLQPFNNHDGLELSYRAPLGSGALGLSAFGGSSQFNVSAAESYDLPRVSGFVGTWENDSLLVRAGASHFTARSTGPSASSFMDLRSSLLAAVPAGCTACNGAARVVGTLLDGVTMDIWNVGFRYRRLNTQVWGEYAQQKWGPYTPRYGQKAATLGVSQSFDDWTPYAAVSHTRFASGSVVPLPVQQITAVNNVAIRSALLAYQATLVPTDNSRSTLALGVRWDLQQDHALKLELLRVQLSNPLSDLNAFPKSPGSGPRSQKFTLLSASWDFVF